VYTTVFDAQNLKKSVRRTRLGWFRNNTTGVTRWGIEVDGADDVEWVEKPEKPITRELAKNVVWNLQSRAIVKIKHDS
jgi:hypothetical protein